MAGLGRDEGFRLPAREGHRHEGRAEVVGSNGTTGGGPLEELATVHSRRRKVAPEVVGQVARIRDHEDPLFGPSKLLPCPKRFECAGVECPRSRVVGLVFVEPHHPALEVEIGPRQGERFAGAHALTREEAVQDAVRERDRFAREEARFLVGVEGGLGFPLRELREEAPGKGGRRQKAARVDGKREEP